MNDVMKYRLPMTLWSVVVSHLTNVVVGDDRRGVADSAVRRNVAGIVAAPIVSCSLRCVSLLWSWGMIFSRLRSLLSWPDVALRPEVGHVGVVLGPVHDLDVEEHPGVVGAAELGALAGEGPRLVGHHLEGVDPAGDHVELLEEGRHPEGVDDVPGGEVELDPLADREVERREGLLHTGLAGQLGLRPALVCVVGRRS